MDVVSHKCPNCGSSLAFSVQDQQIKCESCGTTYDQEQMQKYQEMLENSDGDGVSIEWKEYRPTEYRDGEMRSYRCPSCAGEILADETTAATRCPYCDNPTLLSPQLTGMYAPDYVIPFKFDKKEALDRLKKYYNKRFLLPRAFKTQHRMELIQSLYVPFWLFDCHANGNLMFDAKIVTHSEDSRYRYTHTQHYLVSRAGNMDFSNIPVDGSSKIDDALMESIEPFDYSQMVPFDGMYLAGILTNKYDVDDAASKPRADKRVEQSVEQALRDTVRGYTSVFRRGGSISVEGGEVSYALLPVWLLATRYKNKVYNFAMNGQTGKFVGDLPVSVPKFLITSLVIFLTLLAILWYFLR
ncbi:MAG: hypothetical protein Q4A52_06215 [Bacillota bacterium]|nr:hypothetical protein [Bacillota bacterium]